MVEFWPRDRKCCSHYLAFSRPLKKRSKTFLTLCVVIATASATPLHAQRGGRPGSAVQMPLGYSPQMMKL